MGKSNCRLRREDSCSPSSSTSLKAFAAPVVVSLRVRPERGEDPSRVLVLGVLAVLVTIVAMTLVGLLFRRGSSRSFRTSALVVTVVIAALTLLGARRSLQRPSPAHYLASTAQVGFLGVSSTAKRSVDLPEGARLIESCDALGCAQCGLRLLGDRWNPFDRGLRRAGQQLRRSRRREQRVWQ